jgi:hypothetical protein
MGMGRKQADLMFPGKIINKNKINLRYFLQVEKVIPCYMATIVSSLNQISLQDVD